MEKTYVLTVSIFRSINQIILDVGFRPIDQNHHEQKNTFFSSAFSSSSRSTNTSIKLKFFVHLKSVVCKLFLLEYFRFFNLSFINRILYIERLIQSNSFTNLSLILLFQENYDLYLRAIMERILAGKNAFFANTNVIESFPQKKAKLAYQIENTSLKCISFAF
jgi:hypothetical protein